jgi:hypothetical protein
MHLFVLAMKADAERRKKLRKKPLSLVYVELASSNGGMMRDLSEEGFAVRAMIPLRTGQKTPFAFSLGESTRIEGEGLVDWTEENGRIAGVKFVNIATNARDLIDEWLLLSDEPPTREQDASSPPRPEPSTIEELREELRTAPPRPVPAKKEEPPSSEAIAQPVAPQPPSGEQPSPTGPPESPARVPEDDIPFPLEPTEPLSVAEEPTEAASPSATPENGSTKPPIPASSILPALQRRWRMPASSMPAPPRESEPGDFPLPERDPNLPDISSILIQPRGTSPWPRAERARPEHLPALEEQAAQSPPSWTAEFTLSRAITIMLILTFVVATYVFHRAIGDGLIWLGEKIGGTRQEALRASVADQAGAPGTAFAPEAGSNPPSAGLPASKPEIQERPITGSAQSSFPTINPPSTATPLPETSSSAVTPGNEQAGQPEYLQALQILRANSGVATVEVVRLLWIAVEKGNPSAEIVLADLYWHAKGVARNCDQTRILLTAAARKGSAVAQKLLQQFQQEGCE